MIITISLYFMVSFFGRYTERVAGLPSFNICSYFSSFCHPSGSRDLLSTFKVPEVRINNGGGKVVFVLLFLFDSANNTVRGNWGRYTGKSSWVIQVSGAL